MVIRNILTSIKVGDLEEGYDLLKTLRRINSWSDQIFCYLQLTLLIRFPLLNSLHLLNAPSWPLDP